MSIFIHMLSKQGQTLRVAAYYPVPDAIYDESSVDGARTPASNRLTQAEIDDVKRGKIFEVIANVDVAGKDEAQVKAFLEARYTGLENNAMAQYRKMYSDYVGEAFDGSVWT